MGKRVKNRVTARLEDRVVDLVDEAFSPILEPLEQGKETDESLTTGQDINLAEGSAGLTRDVERRDSSPLMARTQQSRANKSGKEAKREPAKQVTTDAIDLSQATFDPRSAEANQRFMEAEQSIRRATNLINSNPEIIEDLLPSIAELMHHVGESSNILTRKDAAEVLELSVERVKDLMREGRLGHYVWPQYVVALSQLLRFKGIERHAGRPVKS